MHTTTLLTSKVTLFRVLPSAPDEEADASRRRIDLGVVGLASRTAASVSLLPAASAGTADMASVSVNQTKIKKKKGEQTSPELEPVAL